MSNEAHALGDFILRQNPYGRQTIEVPEKFVNVPLEKARKRQKRTEAQASRRSNKEQKYYLDGPAAALNAQNHLPGSAYSSASRGEPAEEPPAEEPTPEDLEDDDAVQERILYSPAANLWWYFDGQAHRVVKAIRIPYHYTPPVPDTKKPDQEQEPGRTEYLLIGFVGYGTP